MDPDALLDQVLEDPSRPQPEAIFALKERLLGMRFSGGSFLHFLAANHAHWQNLAAALMIGFDLWELDEEEMTPLLAMADDWGEAWGGKVRTAVNLLWLARLSGVDPVEYLKYGEGERETFLHILVSRGIYPMWMTELLKGLKRVLTEEEYRGVLEVRDWSGNTLFLRALEAYNLDVAWLLAKEGVDEKAVNAEGKNALHLLMENLLSPVWVAEVQSWARRLIDGKGLSPNARVKEGELAGMTALHALCKVAQENRLSYSEEEDEYPELVRELLYLGARPNAPLRPVLNEEGKEVPLSEMSLSKLEEVLEDSPVGLAVGHPGVLRALYEGIVPPPPDVDKRSWAYELSEKTPWQIRGIFLPVHLRKAEERARRALAVAVKGALEKEEVPRGGIGSDELRTWYNGLLVLDWRPVIRNMVLRGSWEEIGALKNALGYLESAAVLHQGIRELLEEPRRFGLTLREGDRDELWSFTKRASPLVTRMEKLREGIERAMERVRRAV